MLFAIVLPGKRVLFVSDTGRVGECENNDMAGQNKKNQIKHISISLNVQPAHAHTILRDFADAHAAHCGCRISSCPMVRSGMRGINRCG